MKSHPLEHSLWYDTAAPAPPTEPPDGDARADVAVIGAGYTGLPTALHLAKAGVRVVVIEAEEAGYGGSGRNAGHCSPIFLHHTPEQVVAALGPRFGPRMIDLQIDAGNLVFGLIEQYGIDCEGAQNGLITAAHTPSAVPACEAKCAQYTALGKAARVLDREEVASLTGSERYAGGWFHPEGGHLNPLGYARGLARAAISEGAVIHTASPVRRVVPAGTGWRVETPRGAVVADKVVIATNAYTGDFWPKLNHQFFAMRAYMVASEPLSENVRRTVLPKGNNAIDTRNDAHFYKLNKDGRFVTGSIVNWRRGRDMRQAAESMSRRVRYLFPQIGEPVWSHLWYGYIAVVPDMLPRLHSPAPGVAMAYGFSGRGVPTGTAVGTVLAKWAEDVPEDELAMPFSSHAPIHTRRLLGFAVPEFIGPLYRWRDRRSMKKDGLAPPAL